MSKILGWLLVVLGGLNIAVQAHGTGASQGMYFWFPSLLPPVLGSAIIRGNLAVIGAVFSAAAVPLMLYTVDHLVRVVTGQSIWGLTQYLYHPGMTSVSFILAHGYLLIWPAVWSAYRERELPRRHWNWALGAAGAFHFTVWGLSYWGFPDHQNVNCIHASCIAGWEWAGLSYRVAFITTLIALSAALYALFAWASLRFTPPRPLSRHWALSAVVLVSLVTAADWVRWNGHPRFTCLGPFEDSEVRIGCSYTAEWSDDQFMLAYSVENKATYPRFCHSRIELNGEEHLLHEKIWAEPQSATEVWVVVPSPSTHTQARLLASCED